MTPLEEKQLDTAVEFDMAAEAHAVELEAGGQIIESGRALVEAYHAMREAQTASQSMGGGTVSFVITPRNP